MQNERVEQHRQKRNVRSCERIEPRARKSENGRASTKKQGPPFTLTGHKPKLTNTGPLETKTNSRQRVPTVDAGTNNYPDDATFVGGN